MKKLLSKRAEKLYARLERGAWYMAFTGKEPKAMQELIDAKLVGIAGRPMVVAAAYVPKKGYTPYRNERFAVLDAEVEADAS